MSDLPATRATKLLALAASSESESEARTAALTAALLISKHGLKVVAGATTEATDEDDFGDADPVEILRRMWRDRAESERRREVLFQQGFNRGYYDRSAPPPKPLTPPAEAPPGGSWVKVIGVKACTKCGVQVENGQDAYSVKASGAWQYWCRGH